jgi:hypothetical protein
MHGIALAVLLFERAPSRSVAAAAIAPSPDATLVGSFCQDSTKQASCLVDD